MIKSSEIKKGDLLLDYEFPAYLYVTGVTDKEIDILVLQESTPLRLERDVIVKKVFDVENTVKKVDKTGDDFLGIFPFIFEDD